MIRRFLVRVLGDGWRSAWPAPPARAPPRRGFDVEGTATEVDEDLEPRTPRLPR